MTDPYKDIILTLEEEAEALYEGKKKKYFHEKHWEYWQEKEKEKGSRPVVEKYKND